VCAQEIGRERVSGRERKRAGEGDPDRKADRKIEEGVGRESEPEKDKENRTARSIDRLTDRLS